ncbi:MAG: hypothetical protein CVV41_02365 [Candidatus Riflebacteria bacterium HGW-Riflebacteria-1]|nr:MAG: hypothetical protein CVV41_02365 [Candidatus Riflebacteria bacterium HGW-Riflebacteria-1]
MRKFEPRSRAVVEESRTEPQRHEEKEDIEDVRFITCMIFFKRVYPQISQIAQMRDNLRLSSKPTKKANLR